MNDMSAIKRRHNGQNKAFSTGLYFAQRYLLSKTILDVQLFQRDRLIQYWKSSTRLDVSVNQLPYTIYKQLGLGKFKPTPITLQLANRSLWNPKCIIENVLVQIDNLYFPADFIVIYTAPSKTFIFKSQLLSDVLF